MYFAVVSAAMKNTTEALQRQKTELAQWYGQNRLDLEAIANCTQALISFYELFDEYRESEITRLLMTYGALAKVS